MLDVDDELIKGVRRADDTRASWQQVLSNHGHIMCCTIPLQRFFRARQRINFQENQTRKMKTDEEKEQMECHSHRA